MTASACACSCFASKSEARSGFSSRQRRCSSCCCIDICRPSSRCLGSRCDGPGRLSGASACCCSRAARSASSAAFRRCRRARASACRPASATLSCSTRAARSAAAAVCSPARRAASASRAAASRPARSDGAAGHASRCCLRARCSTRNVSAYPSSLAVLMASAVTDAPAFISASTHAVSPSWAALSSAVYPFLCTRDKSAPPRTSASTASGLASPSLTTITSGVWPSLLRAFGSARCSSRSSMASAEPARAAL
eukprot:scaffold91456_cov51-Phaeocystis_antarctica.AAC.1